MKPLGIGVDVRTILEWFLEKQGGKVETGSNWLRRGTCGRLF
jgi:hypothetical protein